MYALLFFCTPFVLVAQSKPATVVKPQYNVGVSVQGNVKTESILDRLVVSTSTEVAASSSSTTDDQIEVTTELGKVVLPLASSTEETQQNSGDAKLSSVVERINQDYEVAEQKCQNGSWLERVWCSLTSWL